MARKGYLDFFREMAAARYPHTRLDIANRGVPGDTAGAALYRLSGEVLDRDPDAVLVQFALNDAFMGVQAGTFYDQVAHIVQSIERETEAETVLVTSVFIRDQAEYGLAMKFYDALEKLAAREKLPLARVHRHWEDAIARGADHAGLVQWDGVHPTVEGYRLMAEAVFALFDS
jgi:lysophospholipase L1-like esterase